MPCRQVICKPVVKRDWIIEVEIIKENKKRISRLEHGKPQCIEI
jgi:hypothetical protein